MGEKSEKSRKAKSKREVREADIEVMKMTVTVSEESGSRGVGGRR